MMRTVVFLLLSTSVESQMGLGGMGGAMSRLKDLGKMINASKRADGTFDPSSMNITQIMEQLKGTQSKLETEKKERESKPIFPFWLGCLLGVLFLFSCGILCWLLADEYRQSQLKKKGYTTVPASERM